jgi:hypothetical protein
MLQPSASISLEEVTVQFAKWRATKRWRFDRIPADLMEAALHLRAHYPITVLMKHLKLSSSFFKKAQQAPEEPHGVHMATDGLTFVPLAMEAMMPSPTFCQVIRADGCQLVFQTLDPLSVVKAFLCSA